MRTKILMAICSLGALLGASAAHAQNKDVRVLHWWTSGGEAAALSVLKKKVDDQGFNWQDIPVAGGGGAAALTALKAMVAAGNYPTASQMQGSDLLDYVHAGKLGDITDIATSEGWADVVPKALQKYAVVDGKWVGIPINIHATNWMWVNKAVFDKIGGAEPKTFDDFIALLDKAKAAGVVPLALGGQDWQESILFDNVVLSTGGIDFWKKAFVDLDDTALSSDTMKKSFDNLAKLKAYVDPNFAGRDWNLATAMVIKGDALTQVMGDWAKGEFVSAKQVAGKDFACFRFPGTQGTVIYNSDIFGMFDVSPDRKAGQAALAKAIMSKDVQSGFNVLKGSAPARTDVADTDFDACGKKGIADLKEADKADTLVGSFSQTVSSTPAIAGAYHDVVTKFFHGQIASSDEAVKQLAQAIDDAK